MRVMKQYAFESSHQLPRHPGKCARLHGHSWVLGVGIEGYPDPDSSFVLDYADLGELVSPLVDFLDHRHLNFLLEYPSSENVCQFFGRVLHNLVDGTIIQEVTITLKETQKTEAIWRTSNPRDIKIMTSNSGSHALNLEPFKDLPDNEQIILGYGAVEVGELRATHEQFRRVVRATLNQVHNIRELCRQRAVRLGIRPENEHGGTIRQTGAL